MKRNKLESPLEFRLKKWHGEDWHTSKGRIIRDIVYSIDTGLITTIAFLAGVSVSLIVTRSILIAGGVSCGIGFLLGRIVVALLN